MRPILRLRSSRRAIGRGTRSAAIAALLACGSPAIAALGAATQPAPPTLEELVQAADLSSLAASPDGRKAAFRVDRASVGRNGYDLGWYVLDLETGVAIEAGGGGDAIVVPPGLLSAEAPIWSADGKWFFYRALREGEVQVWRAAADGGGTERVTREEGDIRSLEQSLDGQALLLRVGPPREDIQRAELAEYESGILVDEHVELAQNLFRGAMINGRHATERLTGGWFARSGLLGARQPRLRRLDFATLAVSDATEQMFPAPASFQGKVAPEATARSQGGDVAAALWANGEAKLVALPANARRGTTTCAAPACPAERIGWLAWRPGRDEILFATSGDDRVQTLRLWEVGSGKVRTLIKSRGLLSGGRAIGAPCAVAAEEAVCVAAAPTSAPRLARVRLDTGAARDAFDPNALLRARSWPIAQRLEWRSPDGHLFTGTLFLPAVHSSRPLPLFIDYYLCEGFERGGLGDEWPFTAFAASGIAAVCISATRTADGENAVDRYRAAQGGIEALVDLLARRGIADRARVGMGGLSFGSEVTMWMLLHSNLVAAASLASPQFEPWVYWANGVRGREHHAVLRKYWGLGAPEETPEQWRLLSPALNVERIKAPLLLQLSEQESRYATELYARLSNSSTPTELYAFPDEGHIKMQPRHRLAVYRRNLDWFRFWLLGERPGEPGREDQFKRWQALAERAKAATQAPKERSQSSSEASSKSLK